MTRWLGRDGAAGVASAAIIVSGALHIGLLAGLAEERGAPLQAYAEQGILIQDSRQLTGGATMLQPPDYLPLPSPGCADLRCRVSAKGYFDECRWIRESGPGVGDRIMKMPIDARPAEHLVPGQIVTIRVNLDAPRGLS